MKKRVLTLLLIALTLSACSNTGGTSNWEEFRSAPNWVDYILGQNLVTQPGERFNYGTGATHLMAAALEQAVGTVHLCGAGA